MHTKQTPVPLQRPVLLVHGIFNTGYIFRKMAPRLREAGFDARTIDLIPPDGSAGLDALSRQVAAYVEEHFRTRPFALVGFSMGGLVSRAYLQNLKRPESDCRSFVSISTPHQGSLLGYTLRNQGAREMRPGSPWLQRLNGDIRKLEGRPFLSWWTPLDLMILPAWSSDIPQAERRQFWSWAHPRMLFHSGLITALTDHLESLDWQTQPTKTTPATTAKTETASR
ncbi:MAG: esterase/lipase family protein [Verrucomicrobiota bacterium]